MLTQTLLPLLWATIGFGLLIAIHEFGHYAFAKLFNIGTPIFSIGFGPSLIKKKIGDTEFRLAPIPLGGYCAIEGAEEAELNMTDTKKSAGDRSFATRSYWKKFLVLTGGIMFNMLFAYGVFTFLNFGNIQEKQAFITVQNIVKESPAAGSDLQAGDQIRFYDEYELNQNPLHTQQSLAKFLKFLEQNPDQKVHLTVQRKQEQLCIPVRLGNKNGRGSLGIGLDIKEIPTGKVTYNSLSKAISIGITMTHHWTRQTVSGLLGMFKKRSLEGVGGPVMLLSQSFQMAQVGLSELLRFLAIISISLAVINLIPFGPLDGGQLLFTTVEAVIRRKIPARIKETLTLGAALVLLVLILFLSYKDIGRFIGF